MNDQEFWLTFGPLFAVNIYVLSALVVFAFIYKKVPQNEEVQDRHSSIILNKWIREYWMWVTSPIFKVLVYFKVTPNFVSGLGAFFALLCALAFAFHKIGLAGWFMVIGASFDFFDGRLARLTNQRTEAGSFFDSSLDRVSEGLALTGVAYMYHSHWLFWVGMAAYLGSMLTSYTKAKGETMGVDYSGGMMQRPERIAYLGAGAIITPMIAYFAFPALQGMGWVSSVNQLEEYLYAIPLAFVALLCNIASWNRIGNIMKLLNKKEFGSENGRPDANFDPEHMRSQNQYS
ncbi:MAG: CDP-alcohol phosphatidyltransferase family protein [Deltaproteobacteria bacterium]|nr:CDP-alcohol phosphatidyltransferase family protein [Deltaproteobacteria bacterium]